MADNGSSGMGVIAGVILGVAIVGGGIFFLANNNWHGGGGNAPKISVNVPSAPAPGK